MPADDAPGVSPLVHAALLGDRAALERLWAEYRRYAATVILAHKPASADTDDLLQEVAATLVTKLHTLSDPANFLPWLRMVALNVARLAGRKHAAAIVRPDSEAVGLHGGVSAPPAERADARDQAVAVMDLCRSMPEEYREPLLLQTLRQLSYRQIGEALNLPETTVETRIARARKMLRELVRKAEPGPDAPTVGAGTARVTGGAPARILSEPDDPQ
jgi:RNA polymerase sigma-70 factor (ECF subfamily)